jgi:hypothetical protein
MTLSSTRSANTVERCINTIRAWRGLATRYDKTPRATWQGSSYADPSSGYAASTRAAVAAPDGQTGRRCRSPQAGEVTARP